LIVIEMAIDTQPGLLSMVRSRAVKCCGQYVRLCFNRWRKSSRAANLNSLPRRRLVTAS
jgi:hypothetical protein